MEKQTVRDVELRGKRVLVRVDFNVPLKDTTISHDTRIRACLPTIRYLLEAGARVILASHLGRPGGKVMEGLRLKVVADRLSQLLGMPVAYAPDSVGPPAEAAVGRLPSGGVLMLENLRFHPEEERNDPAFAQALAHLADIYVNDAFGTAHRAHASTVGVAQYLPAVAGFLLEKELQFLGGALKSPTRPLAAVLGGAKVSDKIGVLEHLLDLADSFLLGGGMANTFLKAQGYEVGRSLVEENRLTFALNLLRRAQERGLHILLPLDVVAAERDDGRGEPRTVPVGQVPRGWYIMDLGPRTLDSFRAELAGAKTVIWNGPLGVFELAPFKRGTADFARTLAGLKAVTIIGGGSTAEAVEELGLADKMTHVSTGGGATLEFLEGRDLPGVAALKDSKGLG